MPALRNMTPEESKPFLKNKGTSTAPACASNGEKPAHGRSRATGVYHWLPSTRDNSVVFHLSERVRDEQAAAIFALAANQGEEEIAA